ncbi:phage head-tail connector protein [Mesomycoplasma molare]|uniref:Phage head-tail connector protein n=1 Tax=Mesomycoplasma molare TaxID=171288 RepID=A0ABY5TYE6_9BACT|nr:phage head-tail connector protein [Mesomycoplasma molare]UWD34059.1 phage head-tail connector protein [Mesomycoplasma molare]
MYPSEEIYDWLDQIKINLSIADNQRDEILLDYIEIAHENIWTQYYELKLDDYGQIPKEHPWAYDLKTKLATLHLAAIYFSNPDTTNQAKDVIDERMLYRILGGRISYAQNEQNK